MTVAAGPDITRRHPSSVSATHAHIHAATQRYGWRVERLGIISAIRPKHKLPRFRKKLKNMLSRTFAAASVVASASLCLGAK